MAEGHAIGEPQAGSGDRARSYLEGTYGALLVDRASRRPELWGFVFMALLGGVVFLATADPKPQALDYFNRLAEAFLQGRYWLDEAPSWLNELIPAPDAAGRWYVAYPPMPAVLALPWVAVFGREFPAQVYSSIYAGLATGLVYLVLGRLPVALRIRDRLGLTAVFSFGTCFWFIAISGSAWYFAHVSAVLAVENDLLPALRRAREDGAGAARGHRGAPWPARGRPRHPLAEAFSSSFWMS